MLRDLRRRKVSLVVGDEVAPERMDWLGLPRASLWRGMMRLMAWLPVMVYSQVVQRDDQRKSRAERELAARKLVARVQRLGPYAAKLGLQGVYRFDLLLPELALELERLDDHMEPFPLEEAIKRVEAAIGDRLENVFEVFDPKPISSRVMSCDYQAQLKTGRKVVVRVRRPGVRSRLSEELFAMSAVTWVLELFSFLRPGFGKRLRDETHDMIIREADFRVHARYHHLFRSRVRRDRIRYATCTRVMREYTTDCVMISEFASGVWLGEVITAVRDQDEKALSRLRDMGVRPNRIARRLSQLSWWEIHENLFFHVDPSARDIVIRPGGQIVFVRFSDCATASNRLRRLKRELYRRLREDDVSGATDVMVQLSAPLPFIDTYAFSKRIEARLWQYVFALRDKDAKPWERTSLELWLALFEAAREKAIVLRVDVVQIMRAAVSFDALVSAVNPDFRPLRDFRQFERSVDQREARRFLREREKESRRSPGPGLVARLARLSRLAQRSVFRLEGLVENIPVDTLAMAGKAATMAVSTITLLLRIGGTLLIAGVAVEMWASWHGVELRLHEAASLVARHPLFLAWVLLLFLITTRRLLYRLSDTEKE